MGRTIPSFRMATVEELKEWKEFRNGLNNLDRKVFDRMYATCHLFNTLVESTLFRRRIIWSLLSLSGLYGVAANDRSTRIRSIRFLQSFIWYCSTGRPFVLQP